MALEELDSAAAYRDDPVDRSRRRLLAGLLTAYTASLIPWTLAQPAPRADLGAFTALSAILVGRQTLDAAQTARLYNALITVHPNFAADVQALLTLINERHISGSVSRCHPFPFFTALDHWLHQHHVVRATNAISLGWCPGNWQRLSQIWLIQGIFVVTPPLKASSWDPHCRVASTRRVQPVSIIAVQALNGASRWRCVAS